MPRVELVNGELVTYQTAEEIEETFNKRVSDFGLKYLEKLVEYDDPNHEEVQKAKIAFKDIILQKKLEKVVNKAI